MMKGHLKLILNFIIKSFVVYGSRFVTLPRPGTPFLHALIIIMKKQTGNSMLANLKSIDLRWHLELNKDAVDYFKDKEDWGEFTKRMEGQWSEIPL